MGGVPVDLLQFVRQNLGKRLDWDHLYGAQCVDLIQYYLDGVHGQRPWPGPTASSMAGSIRPGWAWVANGPVNYPNAGDIVVWGPSAAEAIGDAGHIAVALSATRNVLLTFDQNWPPGAAVSIVLHDYRGVRGWFTPDLGSPG